MIKKLLIHKQQVAILILNWNGKEALLNCLTSLKSLDLQMAEVSTFVVDRPSNPAAGFIADAFPLVQVLRMEKKEGFAASLNFGIRKVTEKNPDWVLILGDEVVLEDQALADLLTFAQKNVRAKLLGGAIKFKKGFEIYYRLGGHINTFFGLVTHKQVSLVPNQPPQKTDFVTFEYMLVKSELFQTVGLFEEEYYFYFADVDFCSRVREVGNEVWVVPYSIGESRVINPLLRRNLFATYYQVRGQLRFIYQKVLFPKNLIAYCLYFLVSLKNALNHPRFYAAYLQGWLDFFRSRFGEKTKL